MQTQHTHKYNWPNAVWASPKNTISWAAPHPVLNPNHLARLPTLQITQPSVPGIRYNPPRNLNTAVRGHFFVPNLRPLSASNLAAQCIAVQVRMHVFGCVNFGHERQDRQINPRALFFSREKTAWEGFEPKTSCF